MKTKKLRSITIIMLMLPLCVVIFGTGCGQDDEILWEISTESETSVIQNTVADIEFKFCLLNEAGEQATVFNEGENFTFQFSFKNLKNDTIIVTTEFINDDFFRVYQISSDNLIDMGKPWTGVWCEYSLTPQKIKLGPTIEKQLNCPWVLTENNVPDDPLCVSESKNYLTRGEYTTSFDLNFHYVIGNKKNVIDNTTFKINFKIQE